MVTDKRWQGALKKSPELLKIEGHAAITSLSTPTHGASQQAVPARECPLTGNATYAQETTRGSEEQRSLRSERRIEDNDAHRSSGQAV
ncbi:hypothetical protein CMUS01_04476 [Colletotrichum musicola]|uniref:Uncharacterized protein n=1 Tax=Colletotrichum musicola TaxID=2175873 RepID=A0A8H6NMF8_9PEZI|nr:hypothetical protein CMUS01_04476 [Colletotrichum musicola]